MCLEQGKQEELKIQASLKGENIGSNGFQPHGGQPAKKTNSLYCHTIHLQAGPGGGGA